MRIKLLILFFCINLITISGADDFIIYPEKGQSKEQIEKDKLVVQVRGHVGGVAASGAHQVRSEVEKRITKTEPKATVAAIVVARVRRLARDGVALSV